MWKSRKIAVQVLLFRVQKNVGKFQVFHRQKIESVLHRAVFFFVKKNVENRQELILEIMSRTLPDKTGLTLRRSSIFRMEARTVAWLRS